MSYQNFACVMMYSSAVKSGSVTMGKLRPSKYPAWTGLTIARPNKAENPNRRLRRETVMLRFPEKTMVVLPATPVRNAAEDAGPSHYRVLQGACPCPVGCGKGTATSPGK